MTPKRAGRAGPAIRALIHPLALLCALLAALQPRGARALLPETVTNFQGFYACEGVAAGRPQEVGDVVAQVREATKARATGAPSRRLSDPQTQLGNGVLVGLWARWLG